VSGNVDAFVDGQRPVTIVMRIEDSKTPGFRTIRHHRSSPYPYAELLFPPARPRLASPFEPAYLSPVYTYKPAGELIVNLPAVGFRHETCQLAPISCRRPAEQLSGFRRVAQQVVNL
jgi:hypothetical protein